MLKKSRTVQLVSNDQTVVFGTTVLHSEFPADPPIIIWNGDTYIGSAGYGQIDSYIKNDHVVITDDDVVKTPTP